MAVAFRYEEEECPGVCQAMERTAVIFMTKGEVEPSDVPSPDAADGSGNREIQCSVIPGGFSLCYN